MGKGRYKSYVIPGETLIPGGRGRGSVSPWYWICVISRIKGGFIKFPRLPHENTTPFR